MITPKNITRHELIGLEVEIIDSSDPSLRDIRGRIIDETMKTITVETKGRTKKIPKSICRFRINIGERLVEVSGSSIVGRPQDRIKR